MQDNDPRLFKAAKRSIRAEITLVVIIIIITSWSVYALYKLAVNGSDSLFGFKLSSSLDKTSTGDNKPQISQAKNVTNLTKTSEGSSQKLTYIPLDVERRNKIWRDILNRRQGMPHVSGYPNLFITNNQKQLLMTPESNEPALDPRVLSSLNNLLQAKRHREQIQMNYRRQSVPEPNEIDDQSTVDDQLSDSAEEEDPGDVAASPIDNMVAQVGESQPEDQEGQINDSNVDEDRQADSSAPEEHSDSNEPSDEQTQAEDENEQIQDKATKEMGQDIDEEVDRMTQPSLGVASQQEQPLNHDGAVQFDDIAGPPSTQLTSNQRKLVQNKPDLSGSLISEFMAPNKTIKNKGTSKNLDLQFDHNNLSVHSKANSNEAPQRFSKRIGIQKNSTKKETLRKINHAKINQMKHIHPIQRQNSTLDRLKRSIDFEKEKFQNPISKSVPLKTQANRNKHKQSRKKSKVPKSRRRHDDEDNEEQEEEEEKSEEDNQSKFDKDKESDSSNLIPDAARYRYLTTTDANLQELLAHQQLLDVLNQLPPPMVSSQPSQMAANQTSPTSIVQEPQQASKSLYSIDDGLLLYPSAGEDFKTKSMKKKKHEKMKEKKKEVVAIKKGGHKKKKHNKEEKKYLKEKKFKGAKKGKKTSKGKGNQGGKKGKKFYKDKGFKKKGFKNIYHKEEFGQKKSYFDEFRDKDFKKKWKKYDDKYNYAKMKKWQGKDIKDAKKLKDQGEKYKKYDKAKWKKKYHKHQKEAKKKKSAFELE